MGSSSNNNNNSIDFSEPFKILILQLTHRTIFHQSIKWQGKEDTLVFKKSKIE